MQATPLPPQMRASDRVLDALRGAIQSLALLPGARLDEPQIARAHGVSRTPAREAILALAQEGLVTVRPQAGTFVALIDAAALPEVIEARRVLEELLARRAAERKAPPDLFREPLRLQREAAKAEDAEAFLRADHAFHAALAQAARAPRVGRLAAELRGPVDRFRRLAPAPAGRMKRCVEEHEAILVEIARGEAKQAARAMRRHLAALADDPAGLRARHPDLFLPAGERL